jgi:hypothetical protein
LLANGGSADRVRQFERTGENGMNSLARSALTSCLVILAAVAAMPPNASAVFGVCLEQALSEIRIPRITNAVIIAIFCWRDQVESVVPE